VNSAPLILSPLAEDDLLDIGEFIAQRNLTRAISFVQELRKFLQIVADTPGIGRIRDDLAGTPHSVAFRRFPYVVYYEPDGSSGGIRVLRILHGARDHTQIFGPH
jgi:toxin ParE1/3/4